MRNIPTFKTTNGKTIYERHIVEKLTNAVYADKSSCIIKGKKVNILSHSRCQESWDVVVEFTNEEVTK